MTAPKTGLPYIYLPARSDFYGCCSGSGFRFGRAHSMFAVWAADWVGAIGRRARTGESDRAAASNDSSVHSSYALSALDARVVRHVHRHALARVTPDSWVFPHGRLAERSLSAHCVVRGQALASPYKGASVALAATVLKRLPNRSRAVACRTRVLPGVPSGCDRERSGIASVSNCVDQFSGLKPENSDGTVARGCSGSNRSTRDVIAVTPRHTASLHGTPGNTIAGVLSLGRPWVVPRDIAGTALNESAASTLLARCKLDASTVPRAGVPLTVCCNSGDDDSPIPSVFGLHRAQQQPPEFLGMARAGGLRPLRPAEPGEYVQP